MANFPMLDAIFGHIDANPEEHDQDHFGMRSACGTTLCVAGHAVKMAGMQLVWTDLHNGRSALTGVEVNGQFVDTETAAKEVLGLTDQQAAQLFYCFEDLNTLKGIVKDWANEQ